VAVNAPNNAPSPAPACVTHREQDGSLVIRYQDRRLGLALLTLPVWYFATVVLWAVGAGGVPVSELVGAGVIGVLVLLVPVAMIVNATVITVNDGELIVVRGPLSLSRTKRLRASEIENLHVKAERGQQSGKASFHLRAMLTGVDAPEVLVRLHRDHEPGYYIGNLIYARLGRPGEVGFVGTGKRRGPVRLRPF